MENPKLRIKVFRAVDNVDLCQKYVDGHVRVLAIYGITMITSAKVQWFEDPDTYVIMVESEDGEKLYGGARVQVAKGNYELPIENAIKKFDPSILQIVEDSIPLGTGELCGLWNSREVAGLGIGSIYLGRVGVAVAMSLKLHNLFALCAPATVKNCMRVGFEVEERLGDRGGFFYPKEGLVATAVTLHDVAMLSKAEEDEKFKILALRDNPIQDVEDLSARGKKLEISYNLVLPDRTT
jgi:hypothetical protein